MGGLDNVGHVDAKVVIEIGARPGLAVIIVGFAFLLRGVMQVMAAFTTEAQLSGATGLLAVSGVLSLIVGVLALVWPHATIVVLAVLFGLRVLAVGLVQVAAGWALGKVDVEVIDV